MVSHAGLETEYRSKAGLNRKDQGHSHSAEFITVFFFDTWCIGADYFISFFMTDHKYFWHSASPACPAKSAADCPRKLR